MRFWSPRCVLGLRCDPQDGLVDKFGGLPWGLAAEAWPACGGCGRPQSHVAQLQHDDDRLDLGARGRALVLFQCEWEECAGMTARHEWGGRNAALIVEPTADGHTEPPVPRPAVLPEMRVTKWVAGDDGIDPSRYVEFFSDENFLRLYDEGLLEWFTFETRLGGVPHWLQSFEDGPPPPWRFVLQLAESQRGGGPEPTPDETGWGLARLVQEYDPGPPPQAQKWEYEYPEGTGPGDVRVQIFVWGGGWSVGGPNFGMGTAYVFVNTETDPPAATLFWQR